MRRIIIRASNPQPCPFWERRPPVVRTAAPDTPRVKLSGRSTWTCSAAAARVVTGRGDKVKETTMHPVSFAINTQAQKEMWNVHFKRFTKVPFCQSNLSVGSPNQSRRCFRVEEDHMSWENCTWGSYSAWPKIKFKWKKYEFSKFQTEKTMRKKGGFCWALPTVMMIKTWSFPHWQHSSLCMCSVKAALGCSHLSPEAIKRCTEEQLPLITAQQSHHILAQCSDIGRSFRKTKSKNTDESQPQSRHFSWKSDTFLYESHFSL